MADEREDLAFLRNGLEGLVEYDKQCCMFLERMRHSSSFEIVQKFKAFVNQFVGSQHETAEQYSQAVHTFIEDVFVSLSEHPLWREESHKAWDWATDAAEKYLMTKLFKVAYVLPCTTDIADDQNFYHRTRLLQFLKPIHFDIPDRPLNQVATEMAAQELYKADSENMKSPKEKLTCILNCITILSNFLKYNSDEQGTGADDLLPYLIFTILYLSPKHMHSNIRYISRFRRQSKMESEAAYYFTQMESAVLFIMDADHRNLSISEQDYRQGMEHCEQVISSGLDISQFVAGSDSSLISRRAPAVMTEEVAKPSPILARKASVIEEWSNLQRTRALSQSESDKAELHSNATPIVGVSTSPQSLPPSSPLLRSSSFGKAGLGGGGARGGVKVEASVGKDVQLKFLSAGFEELTVTELKLLHESYKTLAKAQQTI